MNNKNIVRSCTLDAWSPELLDFMKSVGNKKFNDVWEKDLRQTTYKKPKTESEP